MVSDLLFSLSLSHCSSHFRSTVSRSTISIIVGIIKEFAPKRIRHTSETRIPIIEETWIFSSTQVLWIYLTWKVHRKDVWPGSSQPWSVPPDIVQNYSMIGLLCVNVFRIVQFFLKKVFTNHIKPSIIQIETTRKQ